MGTEEFDLTSGQEGISRREALKRGVKLTGAVLWATPVVQAIGMTPALAQTTSPVACENSFRAKYELATGWDPDPGFGTQDCNDCGGAEGVDGTGFFTIVADENSATVTLTAVGCQITAFTAKGGQGAGSCLAGTVAPGGQSATVLRPTAGGISHVEVCFCCGD